jgi:hypothetical protein
MHFTCKTCKVDFYLGYSSYGAWALTSCKTLKEYDDAEDKGDTRNLIVMQNFRKALSEHEGHDFFTWSSDWCEKDRDGNLVSECNYGKYAMLAEGFRTYRMVNLDRDDRCGEEEVERHNKEVPR